MRDLHGRNNPFYGKHHSPETKRKLSDSRKGKIYPKLSEAKRLHPTKYWLGKKLPKEMKAKIHASKVGTLLGPANPAWEGGTVTYWRPILLSNIRNCPKCGVANFRQKLDLHHIDLNRANNDKTNLLPLCRGCHRKLHEAAYALIVEKDLTNELIQRFLANRKQQELLTEVA